MDRKAQVLIISLWVLVILTVLSVSIGHRVSMGLRLSRYQRDRVKAFCLAKAAVNLAIVEIEKDDNLFDALNEGWADNKEKFEKVVLNDNTSEFARVSYNIGEPQETKFGATDEERKININAAPQDLIISLLEACGIDSESSEELSKDILIWRGSLLADKDIENYYLDNLGYNCKGAKLSVLEELPLIKGMSNLEKGKIEKLKTFVTIYGEGKININTATKEILMLIGEAAAKQVPDAQEIDVRRLIEQIDTFRNSDSGPFKDDSGINDFRENYLTEAKEKNILNQMQPNLSTKSTYFRIEATGYSGKIRKKITAVYGRANRKIISWHEN